MKIRKKLLSLALACTMAVSMLPAFSTTAHAQEPTTTYTLTIPSTLTVADKGWNATDGISATGTLESGKKLTVTAASANSWALKSGDNSVSYNLATATGDYSSTAKPASWEFTELSSTVATKSMGIIVDDYSTKPAGTYQDTVTFTAAVESASTLVTAITLNKTETTIAKGSTETLSVSSVTPDDATDQTVTWSSDNESVATVDENGVVTAVAMGTANITATANDGSGVSATCAVTVNTVVTITQSDFNYGGFTKDGVTVRAGSIDPRDGNLMSGGSFSTSLGNFTKIQVSCNGYFGASGSGWSGSTWTGNASTVSFSGDMMGMGMGITIVCTIGPAE